MGESLPAITGKQLIRLLIKGGWLVRPQRGTHGKVLYKRYGERNRITVVPDKSKPLPSGTLADILGMQQTGLGRAGLKKLIRKYGIR